MKIKERERKRKKKHIPNKIRILNLVKKKFSKYM